MSVTKGVRIRTAGGRGDMVTSQSSPPQIFSSAGTGR